MTPSASQVSAVGGSVLASLLITARLPVDYLQVAWAAAAASVPATKPMLNVRTEAGKVQAVAAVRSVQHRAGDKCLRVARMCDMRPAEIPVRTWANWRWEVSARAVTDAASEAGGPPAVIRLEVTRYRITSGRVQSAVELALFRHLVVSGFRAADPGLTVVGGQHDWDDEWWRIPPPAAVSQG